MHYRNDVSEFTLKDTVKVFTASNGYETVAVCQLGEHTDVIVIFKLAA
jgi:hypothetical protein